MSTSLWLEGRNAVVAAADPGDWRGGTPDYALTDEVVPKQRTTSFEEGSLELVVENLVRVFEMEVSHKHDPATWVSVVADRFRTRVNGGPWADGADIVERGSYNVLVGESVFYDSTKESFDSSHDVFHAALPNGFFWEVLEILSPPPVVAFKWRHWGAFEGEYKGNAPTGETIEMFGVSIARLSDDLKLAEVEHFYDSDELLSPLAGGCPIRGTTG
ncbi:SnoaL-like polyketide cyclase [Rhodococcoides yunnanense]|uniref:SnoaL-like polyketide cyclase n=1 Tax=Rhodococcoides yunnanense TaxID=278209 RepID=UPI001FEC870D|nr:SnoaL-like polyketide cyclase [Rhodococcus yunnanensis]